jgi:hypothetical protein
MPTGCTKSANISPTSKLANLLKSGRPRLSRCSSTDIQSLRVFFYRIVKIKSHRAVVPAQGEAIQLCETAFTEMETQLTSILRLEDAEITAIQRLIARPDEQYRSVVETRIQDVLSQRKELRASVVR